MIAPMPPASPRLGKSSPTRNRFEVVDAAGQSIAYVYFDVQDRPTAIKPKLTRDLARRVAANIAKRPALLAKP